MILNKYRMNTCQRFCLTQYNVGASKMLQPIQRSILRTTYIKREQQILKLIYKKMQQGSTHRVTVTCILLDTSK